MAAAPLTLAELAGRLAAIGGFEARPRLAVAVSGGPDSMALVLLLDRWARQQGGCATALIVDHGLRPESAAEAATAAGWLEHRGIARQILRWDGAKPNSGIQEAARNARYGLLAGWCRRHGVLHLLTAHQREDQVETHLIRRRAGSGVDGLAAMSAVRELAGCRLVRPLLAVPRARLAALLAAEDQPFLDDPSNRNPAFERARVRRAMDAGRVDALHAELRAYGHRRIAREAALDRLLAAAVALHPAGFAAVDPGALAGAEPELVERLLARVAACIGAARYPPRRDRVARLRAGLLANPERPRTLGGCRFVPWRGRILVLRELVAAAPPVRLEQFHNWRRQPQLVIPGLDPGIYVPHHRDGRVKPGHDEPFDSDSTQVDFALEPGETALWDQRFFFALAHDAAGGLTLGYLGQGGAVVPPQHANALPRLLHPILPALWDAAGLVAVPHLGWRRPEPATALSVCFRPANPLTRASFTVV